jgi:hypothetical protein
MSTFLWFLLAVLYLTALLVLGLPTLRKATPPSFGLESSFRSSGSWAP